MDRIRVEKALKRMMQYMDDIDNGTGAAAITKSVFTGNYKEAWIRAYMEADIERLDENSQVWFIEDEDTYQKAYANLLDRVRYGIEVNMKMLAYLEELEELEEDE